MDNAQETAAKALARLSEPFASKEVKWLVAATSRDGRKGRITAYADPRAYTDRLNEVFTPSGWTREYEVHTLSPITRIKKDKPIQTGKVLVTCMVTIATVSCMHSGSGEAWADDENAMTSAEAQAFKRACSCFGLGRYFYNFDEIWVELNEYRQPKQVPQLPAWALPADEGRDAAQRKEPTPTTRGQATTTRGPIDASMTDKITGFRRELGGALFEDVLLLVSGVRCPSEIPNQGKQQAVFSSLEKCQRGMQYIRERASELEETRFYAILDELKIASLDRISSFEAFKQLGKAMSAASHKERAA